MPTTKQSAPRLGKLFWAGLILIVSYPISSIVSFALVAILIGETALETDTGQMTTLGNLVQFIPVVVGIGLIGVDLVYKPKIKRIGVWVVLAGIVLVAVAFLAILQDPGTGGANIGAGILLMVGIALALAGLVGTVIGIARRPAPE